MQTFLLPRFLVDSNQETRVLTWPPRSPDLTPCDFFLWGYIKDFAYKPPLMRTFNKRISTAL